MTIGYNGGLPIDLGNDGPTDNGTQSLPGPNNWMNYPTISSINGLVITGSAACVGCTVYIYQAIGNPRAAYGGGDYRLFRYTDATGTFTATLPATVGAVTMVACDNANNCSEMSPEYFVNKIYLPLVKR